LGSGTSYLGVSIITAMMQFDHISAEAMTNLETALPSIRSALLT
jgi:hypothetical protein